MGKSPYECTLCGIRCHDQAEDLRRRREARRQAARAARAASTAAAATGAGGGAGGAGAAATSGAAPEEDGEGHDEDEESANESEDEAEACGPGCDGYFCWEVNSVAEPIRLVAARRGAPRQVRLRAAVFTA